MDPPSSHSPSHITGKEADESPQAAGTKSLAPNDVPPWRAVLYDGYSVGLAERAWTLLNLVVEPACKAIADEIAGLERGPDGASVARWDSAREMQLEVHRSFALALGGMWERHFRRHLWHSAAVICPKSNALLKRIEKGEWKDLVAAFEKVRGFSLSKFSSYDDLAKLYDVTSAVRHGNGAAAVRLYADFPDLFSHKPVRNWHTYLTLGGEPPHSIHSLEIDINQLRSFTKAIAEFWEAVSELQRDSEA